MNMFNGIEPEHLIQEIMHVVQKYKDVFGIVIGISGVVEEDGKNVIRNSYLTYGNDITNVGITEYLKSFLLKILSDQGMNE